MDFYTKIEPVVKDFYYDEANINEILLDPAIEVVGSDSVPNQNQAVQNTQNDNLIQKLMKQIDRLITNLNGMIQKAFLKFTNYIKRIMQTDRGFGDKCREAIRKNKPLEGVKLISYTYNEAVLEKELTKINQIMTKYISDLNGKSSYSALRDPNTANELDKSSDDIYKDLFRQMGTPSDVNNINTYFLYIKQQYRGEKKEQLFVASKVREYYNITEGKKELTKKIKASQSTILNQVAVLKSSLHNTIQNKDADPQVKKRAIRQCSNLSHLYNFYTKFIDVYLQLKIERIFIYRTVLKKIYRF